MDEKYFAKMIWPVEMFQLNAKSNTVILYEMIIVLRSEVIVTKKKHLSLGRRRVSKFYII